jgi:two-component system phosphate regulon response regulator PhoB
MLRFSFARENWNLLQIFSGEDALKLLQKNALNNSSSGPIKNIDCIILDIMLPGIDGLKTLKKIREIESFFFTPIIMCTARGEEADIVSGLELGADDYVVKPYSPRVLAARIRALLRRKESFGKITLQEKKCFIHGALHVDIERHEAFFENTLLYLSATEFAILVQLASEPNIVFTRQKLIDEARGLDYPVTERSVDVHIVGLRKKLKAASSLQNADIIETVRGVGYRLKSKTFPRHTL